MTVHYFSPGPAILPKAVRETIHSELLDTFGIGVSIMEISHRSKQYDALNEETHVLARKVFQVPFTHELLFTPFGAQQHFSLIIHHMSQSGDTLAYTDTGIWAHLAVLEAQNVDRNTVLLFNGAPEYRHLGNPAEWQVPPNARYAHITVNNTVYGTEYAKIPTFGSTNLVLDMTSSIGAREDIPWDKTAIIYASAQKNFGIAGTSIVIVRKDVLLESRKFTKRNQLGNALCYGSIFDAKSALNTPPVFPIYAANRMLRWMDSEGGVPEMEKRALKKAELIYGEIDKGFYGGRAEKPSRSRHNFVFQLPTKELDDLFIKEAADQGLLEIKGYRTTGGMRASMYNGVSVESATVFAEFMKQFRTRHA